MGIEIERKFLVDGDGWRGGETQGVPIAQGYLVDAAALEAGLARSSVRVRVAGERAWLNIKAARMGIERAEFDYEVPLADARFMLEHLCSGAVEKVRHHVRVQGAVFEVDCFDGENAGLVVAEIELPGTDAAFPRPAWLGREVSHLGRYYNVNLIDHPYSRWSPAERAGEEGDAC